jgi:hypothetical protein
MHIVCVVAAIAINCDGSHNTVEFCQSIIADVQQLKELLLEHFPRRAEIGCCATSLGILSTSNEFSTLTFGQHATCRPKSEDVVDYLLGVQTPFGP